MVWRETEKWVLERGQKGVWKEIWRERLPIAGASLERERGREGEERDALKPFHHPNTESVCSEERKRTKIGKYRNIKKEIILFFYITILT